MNSKMFSKLAFLNVWIVVTVTQSCNLRDYGCQKLVCVCNSTYCDFLGPIKAVEAPQALIYTSNKAGLRFDETIATFQQTINGTNKITVNHNAQYQTIIGFGGAFTDSTGLNILSLSNSTVNNLLSSLFSENGIEYNLGRVPMGSTDFSSRSYSYNDGPVDKQLNNFDLASEDFIYKIPLIQIAQTLSNNTLLLLTSTWTAPAWMKTNNESGGNGAIKTDMYQTWADYFVKFLDSYAAQGISFWGLTTGNEPSSALIPTGPLNSVAWSPRQVATWVAENLGPTIRGSQHSSVKILALDDHRFFLPWFISNMFENTIAKDYVDGIAVHWYFDTLFPAELLSDTHSDFPDKFILGTEACVGQAVGVDLGSWENAEKYATDIIQDLQNWVSGWIDWNMALDLSGGPTYLGDYIDSPIIVNATGDEFYKQPMHYAFGHFSKFLTRGSIRIDTVCPTDIKLVAFDRPDDSTVLVILNDQAITVPISLVDTARGEISLILSANSVTSVLYW